ncbi:MAG: energy transducer TonB [Bacteroidota bacterium]|nr:energy transducer TonB [Bacteroidota bacterium]
MRLPVILLITVSICLFSFKLSRPPAPQNTGCIQQSIGLDSIPPDTLSEEEMKKMDVNKVESVAVDRDQNVVRIKLKDGKNCVIVITKELESRADSSEQAKRAAFKRDMQSDTGAIRTKVEIESTYPGGMAAWARFMQKTFSYPNEAAANGIQGAVVVKFIVGVDGNVRDIQAVSGPPELRAEAIRVIKKSGVWIPAVNEGIKVESYKMQPIVFRLERN